jgi:hypothetical protein
MTSGAHISFLQRFAPKTSIADRALQTLPQDPVQNARPSARRRRGGLDRADVRGFLSDGSI